MIRSLSNNKSIKLLLIIIGFNSLFTGDPAFNLPAIDPLHVNQIHIKQGANSPVNVELIFTNVDLHGLSNFRCTYMR